MTAINPDFSATAACNTVIALSTSSSKSRKDIQYIFLWQIDDHGSYLADYP